MTADLLPIDRAAVAWPNFRYTLAEAGLPTADLDDAGQQFLMLRPPLAARRSAASS